MRTEQGITQAGESVRALEAAYDTLDAETILAAAERLPRHVQLADGTASLTWAVARENLLGVVAWLLGAMTGNAASREAVKVRAVECGLSPAEFIEQCMTGALEDALAACGNGGH